MPVPSNITDLSTTPGSNSPAGSESPSTADDYLRTYAAFIKQTYDALPSATNPLPDTKLATSAVIKVLQAAYPVGSIYINATNSTNPATLLGFGTWTAFGAGRVPVGFNTADPLFDTAEETGGSKDAIVVSHTHTTDGAGAHNHRLQATGHDTGGTALSSLGLTTTYLNSTYIEGVGDHTHTISTTGSSGTNANLQPYITVYMWKRTV